jgi:hypothetical protein
VSPRTQAAASPTDRRYWRMLLARCHPDAGGNHDLFIWVQALEEHVSGDGVEEMARETRREPPRHHASARSSSSSGRIPYDRSDSFSGLTADALDFAEIAGEPYAGILRLLEDCEEVSAADPALYRQQPVGASYRQLARIAHEAGMSKQERVAWYRVCEGLGLSMRHASHILSRL